MARKITLLDKARHQPNGLRFHEFCTLLEQSGFVRRRQKGSHIIYAHPKDPHPLPVQEGKSGKAKPYQGKQFRAILDQVGDD